MQIIKYFKSCILFSMFFPYTSFAHLGHGKPDVPEFMHQILYHAFSSWGLLILLGCVGFAVYAWNSLVKNKSAKASGSHNNNGNHRGKS